MGGAPGPSGRSPNVEAVIQSAVAEDSRSPAAAIRAISTCKRPVNGPFSGEKNRRQPPVRRATSRSAGNREGQHRRCARSRREPTRIVEEQRPVEVRHPALEGRLVGRIPPRDRWRGR